ncbi:FmdB family zinc ribbon protein [Pseudothermotoga sp.]
MRLPVRTSSSKRFRGLWSGPKHDSENKDFWKGRLGAPFSFYTSTWRCRRLPLYRYVCPNCKEEQTLLMRMNDEDPKCPKCGTKMDKQIPRIQLKGVGSSSCASNSCSGCSSCSSRS